MDSLACEKNKILTRPEETVRLLATRELSTPLQIAEQSSTTVTHFEQRNFGRTKSGKRGHLKRLRSIAENLSERKEISRQTSSLVLFHNTRLRSSQNSGMLWIRQGDCKSQIASRSAVLR